MAVRNPNRVSAVLAIAKMGAVIKPHLPLSQVSSAKKIRSRSPASRVTPLQQQGDTKQEPYAWRYQQS